MNTLNHNVNHFHPEPGTNLPVTYQPVSPIGFTDNQGILPKPIPDLYEQLMSFQVSDADDELTFEQRLADENDWSEDFANDVVNEYKRFLFLAATSTHPVSPSWEIDQAWHLHLIYSHSYWNELCDNILKFPFHHNPSTGGDSEKEKYFEWYSNTLESYQKTFHESPPLEIWPSPEACFGKEYTNDEKKQEHSNASRIIWGLQVLFAIFVLIRSGPFAAGISYFITSFLYLIIKGDQCKNCLHYRAMEKTSRYKRSNKAFWSCQYCDSTELRYINNKIPIDDIWNQIAKDIGGRYEEAVGFYGHHTLRYRSGEWEITLDTHKVSSENGSKVITRMRAPFVNRDGLYFKIYRKGFFASIRKFFGMQDIQIGDPYFDDNFIIQGNNEEKIRLLLNVPRLKQLIQAQPDLYFQILDDEGRFGAHFPEGVDELHFQCQSDSIVGDEKQLKNLFDLFNITLERLVQIDSAYENDPRVTL